jgi:hypothetical protein
MFRRDRDATALRECVKKAPSRDFFNSFARRMSVLTPEISTTGVFETSARHFSAAPSMLRRKVHGRNPLDPFAASRLTLVARGICLSTNP